MTKLAVALNGRTIQVKLDWLPQDGNHLDAEIDGRHIPVTFSDPEADWDELEWIIVDGRPLELTFDSCLHWIQTGGAHYPIEIHDLDAVESWPCAGDGRIKAPIPGLITAILVEEGQRVKIGRPLLILEAMKMENEIRAPVSGVVQHINVAPGQTVARQELLIEIAE